MSIHGNVPRGREHWWELGCDPLDALSKPTRQELSRRGDRFKAWPGQTLVPEGTTVRWIFIVLEGELALRHEGRDLRVVRAGEMYGAIEVLERTRAPGSLVARDVSRVLALPVNAFSALAETHADFAYWALRTVARQRSRPAHLRRMVG